MSTSNKLTYLNGTKQLLKQKINNLGGSIDDNTTFRQYANQLQNVYDNLPKTEYQEGTEVNLGKTIKGKLDFEEDNGKKVVGIGQSSQESTKGYQLLDLKNGSYSSNNITANVNNGTITISGTASANTFIAVPCNTNYNIAVGSTITISANNSTTADVRMRIDNSGTLDTSLDTINKVNTINVSTALYGNQIYLRVQNGTTLNNFTFKPMLESGTTAHDWEKYTGGQASPNPSYPQTINSVTGNQDVVVSGKNKADWENISYVSQNGATISRNGAEYTVTCPPSGQFGFAFFSQDNLKLKPNTNYVFRAKIKSTTSSSGSTIRVNPLMNTTGQGIYSTLIQAGNVASISFTTPSEIPSDAGLGLYPYQANAVATYTDIMICESTDVNTTYEPYITPTSYQLSLGDIELNAIGDYKDYIWTDRSTKKWYKHSVIKKLVLDGVHQPYWKNSNDSNNYLYYTSIGSKSGDGIIANKLIKKTTSAINGGNGIDKVGMSESGSVFYLNVGYYLSANDLETFKSWLGNNNIDLYYVLKTEDQTDTEITGTLAEQLEAWYNAQSLNGTTIITSNGELPMIIKVRGLKGE